MPNWYPENPALGQVIQSDISSVNFDKGFIAHFQVSATDAVAASTTGVHAAVTDNGTEQVITTNITNPGVPRNITATAGGTATDIGAIQITITGTNYADEVITETLPAFTVDTPGTVEGSKAFKTITSITIPAHDGLGATTSIGWGDKLGLPCKKPHIPCVAAFLDNVLESTAPTVTASATNIEDNTITLNSALNGTVVDVYIIV